MKFLPYLLKHLRRNWIRTSSTVFGMAVCIFLFCTLQTILAGISYSRQSASASRLWTRHAVSLVFNLPLSYKPRIQGVEGVRRVATASWFGGVYQDPKNFFANFAVEPLGYLELYPEFLLPEEQRAAYLRERNACIVGRKTAERFGWKLGDTITLRGTIYPGDWPLVVRGIFRGRDRATDETPLMFHWDYLNERVRRTFPEATDMVGWYLVGVRDPERAAEVSAAITGSSATRSPRRSPRPRRPSTSASSGSPRRSSR